mmetsp:Transcript_60454/g.148719  ORF Transcript_60454/g.148719 Transcript_60454/m.148719 type:complete len:410 (-) Transcript_60454:52-1281(-)
MDEIDVSTAALSLAFSPAIIFSLTSMTPRSISASPSSRSFLGLPNESTPTFSSALLGLPKESTEDSLPADGAVWVLATTLSSCICVPTSQELGLFLASIPSFMTTDSATSLCIAATPHSSSHPISLISNTRASTCLVTSLRMNRTSSSPLSISTHKASKSASAAATRAVGLTPSRRSCMKSGTSSSAASAGGAATSATPRSRRYVRMRLSKSASWRSVVSRRSSWCEFRARRPAMIASFPSHSLSSSQMRRRSACRSTEAKLSSTCSGPPSSRGVEMTSSAAGVASWSCATSAAWPCAAASGTLGLSSLSVDITCCALLAYCSTVISSPAIFLEASSKRVPRLATACCKASISRDACELDSCTALRALVEEESAAAETQCPQAAFISLHRALSSHAPISASNEREIRSF